MSGKAVSQGGRDIGRLSGDQLDQLADDQLVEAIAEALRRRGSQTVSFAESCTGGLLSATFVAIAGISDVYEGSFVTYSNRLKQQVLHVPSSLLRAMGAVSIPVARSMARGVCDVAGTTWGVAVTGIAGPTGGTSERPVGTVCFAWVGPGVEEVDRQQFSGTRTEIQKKSVRHALEGLLTQLG